MRLPTSGRFGSASPMRSAACSDIQAMPQRSPVADYLNALTRELGFDRPLAHRVRQEVEDHLWEATAATSAWPSRSGSPLASPTTSAPPSAGGDIPPPMIAGWRLDGHVPCYIN